MPGITTPANGLRRVRSTRAALSILPVTFSLLADPRSPYSEPADHRHYRAQVLRERTPSGEQKPRLADRYVPSSESLSARMSLARVFAIRQSPPRFGTTAVGLAAQTAVAQADQGDSDETLDA